MTSNLAPLSHSWSPPFTAIRLCGAVLLSSLFLASPSLARDAAFMEPGTSVGNVNAGDAIKVEPKSDIDLGDSPLNVARRTTLFFINQTNAPIQISKMAVNGDSNVTAEIANDDCSKQGTLTPTNRCSVDIVTTPTSAGAWSVETLMTHNGAGRLARAKISGKTSGAAVAEKKDQGLFLSTKDAKPVDFGEVTINEGKSVRSALMVNDSGSPISIYSIDVIEADNGLQRLDQGCAVDMELKPGESCPVTLVWNPTERGRISTDLIIRHSGQLGFAVIPVRGIAKGDVNADTNTNDKATTSTKVDTSKTAAIPMPPSPADVDRQIDRSQAVAASTLALGASSTSSTLHLIGTVGNRALIFKPDGTTAVVQTGDEIVMGSTKAKVVAVNAKSATVTIDGKPKTLTLEAVQELTDRARSSHQDSSSLASNSGDAPQSKMANIAGAPGSALPPSAPAGGLK